MRLWVLRVAHNLAFDERQRHQRLARLDESAWDEVCARLPDPALDPEQRTLERERLERLGAALQWLSAQEQQCLLLRAEGLRYREIGEISASRPLRESPMRETDEAAPASELMEVLHANRMNPQQPLSAASFQTWRQSLAAKREEVSHSQTEAGETLTLRVSAVAEIAVGQITEASLVVRERDWRPQAQSLKVRGEHEVREYELSETADEVISLAALTVFAEPAPTPAATRIPPPAPPPPDQSRIA